MAVEWTEDLSTDVALIDEQHKEIFRRVNNMLEACKTGKGKDAVSGMLLFMEEYVVSHFKAEEKAQKEVAYPRYTQHKAMHDRFLEDVQDLKVKFEVEGPTLTMVLLTNKVIVDWLVQHIKKTDREFGQYMKQFK
ncbi:MAG: hemerythrin family protein [Nitrospirae bacterium]|nr:hemerythrin family protein [Nitrospirota bacterium]